MFGHLHFDRPAHYFLAAHCYCFGRAYCGCEGGKAFAIKLSSPLFEHPLYVCNVSTCSKPFLQCIVRNIIAEVSDEHACWAIFLCRCCCLSYFIGIAYCIACIGAVP